MKKLIILITIILFCCNRSYSQNISNEQWQKVRQEAYLEYIQNGGTTDGFQRDPSIAQDYYKRNYGFDNGGNVQRREILQARRGSGTFYTGFGAVGKYSNGIVYNYQSGLNPQVGFNRGGTFYDSNNNCIGYVNGSTIYNCSSQVIAKIYNGSVVDGQGNLLYKINGENLISFNGQNVTIVDVSMNSLAAFLLFF